MKLLIVDDNERISEMLKQSFAYLFSEIKICSDGMDALNEYEEFKPEWIFMDIKMKKMDGLRASRQILTKYPDTKIIIVTSYESNKFREEAKNAGVVGYVLKDELDKIFKILTVV